MTNNDEVKADAAELLKNLKRFKDKHRILDEKGGTISILEKELRLVLKIARTDEENKAQSQQDCYC